MDRFIKNIRKKLINLITNLPKTKNKASYAEGNQEIKEAIKLVSKCVDLKIHQKKKTGKNLLKLVEEAGGNINTENVLLIKKLLKEYQYTICDGRPCTKEEEVRELRRNNGIMQGIFASSIIAAFPAIALWAVLIFEGHI